MPRQDTPTVMSSPVTTMEHFKFTLTLLWVLALGLGLASPSPSTDSVASTVERAHHSTEGHITGRDVVRRQLPVDRRASVWQHRIPRRPLEPGQTYFFIAEMSYDDDFNMMGWHHWSKADVQYFEELGGPHLYLVQVTGRLRHARSGKPVISADTHWWDMAVKERSLKHQIKGLVITNTYRKYREKFAASPDSHFKFATQIETPPGAELRQVMLRASKAWRKNHAVALAPGTNPGMYIDWLLHVVTTHSGFSATNVWQYKLPDDATKFP